MSISVITIPKRLSRGEELVVVRRSDLEDFEKWKREIATVLAKIRRGRKEYHDRKTIVALSSRAFRS